MRRSQTSSIYFRKRIPADLLGKIDGLVLSLPVGDATVVKRLASGIREVIFSLRTSSTAEGKTRQAKALAYLEGVWDGLRKGPRKLTHKEIVALSGEMYRALADTLEDNPGPPETWARVVTANASAQAGCMNGPLQIGEPVVDRKEAMEERFAPFADLVLSRHGIITDAESRGRLVKEVARAMTDAAFKLWRNAEGDYQIDPQAARFPCTP
jgi:hypothetical protein